MTGDPLVWVDLYHPGLAATFRATDAAFQEIHQHKGWILQDEAVAPLLAQALSNPAKLDDESLRIVLIALYPGQDFSQTPRDQMVARVDVLPHHVDADTPVGRRLAELRESNPDGDWPVTPSPDIGVYDPDEHNMAEVNNYLQGQLDAGNTEEVDRVLQAEEQGQNRKGIVVDGPAAKTRRDS